MMIYLYYQFLSFVNKQGSFATMWSTSQDTTFC